MLSARESVRVCVAQMAPVWLNKARTLDKACAWAETAASQHKADLVAFGEALVPGYPNWVADTKGASFNNKMQKEIFAHYLKNGVRIQDGDLKGLQSVCRSRHMAVVVGVMEAAADRGGHSLYCSRVYIDRDGSIKSVHRKLMPTHDERLVWAQGDGHGLVTHALEAFTVSALNCWENWLPLVRASLYAQGSDLHVALWPGSAYLTKDITRFVAREGRSFVVSASSILRKEDMDSQVPHIDVIKESSKPFLNDGGSCVCGPDGKWVVEPAVGAEELLVADVDMARVREERQNMDPAGHYSRPDVTRLVVNRTRQTTATFVDDQDNVLKE